MIHWYAISDLPPVRCIVRVWWSSFGQPRMIDVARTWRKSTQTWGWMAYKDGDLVHLPPKGRDKAHWAEEPTCWQPMDDRWIWPGDPPTPLAPHLVPRLLATSYAMREVDEAEGAQDSADREPSFRDGGTRWWTDIGRIKYEPPGVVSHKMVEGRVLRALAWCGAGQGLTLPPVGSFLGNLASTAAQEAEEFGIRWHGLPRFQPLPRDRDDFSVAMEWYAKLNPPSSWSDGRKAWALNTCQRVLLMRAIRTAPSFADIADTIEASIAKTRRIYASGIEACWQEANNNR